MRTPEKAIQGWYHKISKQQKLVLLCSFIVGVMTHLFVWTNRFYSADDLAYMFNDIYFERAVQESRIGSWLIQCLLSDVGSAAMQVGLSMIVLAIAAALIVSALKIQNTCYAVLSGAFLVTFPSIACYFCYMSISFGFAVAIFLAVLSVWFLEQEKHTVRNFWLAVVLLMAALSIYQAMLPVVIAMLFLAGFRCYVQNVGDDRKAFWVKVEKDILATGLGLFFFLILSASLKVIFQVEEIDYMGHENMVSFSFKMLPETIYNGVQQVVEYYLTDVYMYMPAFRYAGWSMCIVGGIALLMLWLRTKSWRAKALFVLLVGMAPLCMDTMYLLMNGKGFVHRLMIVCLIFVPIGFMMAAEDGLVLLPFKWNVLLQWILIIAVAIQVYCGYLLSNQIYVRMNNTYEATFSMMTRLTDRLEQLPEWEPDGSVPIYFYNQSAEYSYFLNENYRPEIPEYQRMDSGFLLMGTGIHAWFAPHHYEQYFKIYLSMDITLATPEQIQNLQWSGKLDEMEIFPAASSVQYIDGVVVVRIN